MTNTAVALIVYRRPALTKRVMEVIASVKPRKLLIIADGPRPDRAEDADACAAARDVAERVTWDCEVLKNYAEVNLGCGQRPATGISWVFEQVEEAIILEDDCVPHPSFFPFCEELLARYRNDERIMHINGSTYRREADVPHSYYFSQFIGCWGWATWRRAWQHYDFSVKDWPGFRQLGWLETLLGKNEDALRYWTSRFQQAYDGGPGLTFWDYQWAFACWANSGLGIVPDRNLISNIGCDRDATHTFDNPMGNAPVRPMTFPLRHPPTVLHNWNLDRAFLREILQTTLKAQPIAPLSRVRRALSRLAPEFAKQMYRSAAGRPDKSRILTATVNSS